MAKLYPPNIEGTLPAFYGKTLVIPFSMNKSVSMADVEGISVKFKNIQGSQYIAAKQGSGGAYTAEIVGNTVVCEFYQEPTNIFNIGQYYKVQLAYNGLDGGTGYYSTVGVTKYTAKPDINIEFDGVGGTGTEGSPFSVTDSFEFIGTYENKKDPSEKVYEFKFDILDESGDELITSSEWQLHDINTDELSGESFDKWIFDRALQEGQKYQIIYSVKTNNLLELSTIDDNKKIWIVSYSSVNTLLEASLQVEADMEEGCANLSLKPLSNNLQSGRFEVVRAAQDDNYMHWRTLYKFDLNNQSVNKFHYKDCTIEQGKTYKYAIRQYNSHGFRSNCNLQATFTADFEYAYLSDSERQLKIKYNAKVSSFKDVLLEQKTNTIGGKYPYIFRNGKVRYHEFPIAGLLSCQSDDNQMFIRDKDFDSFKFSANWTGEVFEAERDFKMQVLNWLNNGKPKLFRSPSEGNYIVRLMNSSLSPVDQLGRMLHNFSTTATEIADCTWDNLIKYNLIKVWEDNNPDRYVNEYNETITITATDNLLPENIDIKVKSFIIESVSTPFILTAIDENGNEQLITISNQYPTLVAGDRVYTQLKAGPGASGLLTIKIGEYTNFNTPVGLNDFDDFKYIVKNDKTEINNSNWKIVENRYSFIKFYYMNFKLKNGANKTSFEINGNTIDLAEIKEYTINYDIIPFQLDIPSDIEVKVGYWFNEIYSESPQIVETSDDELSIEEAEVIEDEL